LTHKDVIEVLYELFFERGVFVQVCSDNGFEFTEKRVLNWLERLSVKRLYIEPSIPWKNGHVESFNEKIRYEFLAGEIFCF
jgi:IS30 family transposase